MEFVYSGSRVKVRGLWGWVFEGNWWYLKGLVVLVVLVVMGVS